jgi:ribosome-associated protein
VIEITPSVGVSEHELTFTFERSSGPGGQNVNKVNTRVTLHFDIFRSPSLSNQQKTQLKNQLASRISQEGVLRVVSSKERTQLANRRAAVNRFIALMTEAFHKPPPRKKTSIPIASKKKRLESKVQRGGLKRARQAAASLDGE